MTTNAVIAPKDFDFDYFDNPHGLGYRGYDEGSSGDQFVRSWDEIALYCRSEGIRTAVDIGCAKGFLVRALRRHGIDAVGYDVSDYALNFAHDLPCFKHDVRNGVPNSADAVFCLGVLLYIDFAVLPPVLQHIYAATRHRFYFSSFYKGDEQTIPDPLRRTEETREVWRQLIGSAGFRYLGHENYFDVYGH